MRHGSDGAYIDAKSADRAGFHNDSILYEAARLSREYVAGAINGSRVFAESVELRNRPVAPARAGEAGYRIKSGLLVKRMPLSPIRANKYGRIDEISIYRKTAFRP